ncbi:MAG: polysaccharide deacetylase family protein [bacterium]
MVKNPKFVILLYHKIGKYPENAKFPGLYVAEEDFDRQLKYLKTAGYSFLTLSELKGLYDYYFKKEKNKAYKSDLINDSGRYVSITFDDGSETVYSGGLKIMRENNVKGTVFMVSGLAGGVNEWDVKNGENSDKMLNVSQLKEMMEYGIEIGAHTVTHPRLTQISQEEAYNEILISKKNLEGLLGAAINFFAYPYGDYNFDTEKLVEKAGFQGACITKTGIAKRGADFFALKRVAIRYNTNLFKFKRKIFKVRLFY